MKNQSPKALLLGHRAEQGIRPGDFFLPDMGLLETHHVKVLALPAPNEGRQPRRHAVIQGAQQSVDVVGTGPQQRLRWRTASSVVGGAATATATAATLTAVGVGALVASAGNRGKAKPSRYMPSTAVSDRAGCSRFAAGAVPPAGALRATAGEGTGPVLPAAAVPAEARAPPAEYYQRP
ncbi:hypothetical protein PLESTB_001286100 [Pleodorina starrii]|uniref:Uncharacterized protein n=1 Tax=Pleodorina starrii TaxID=330485 RepID=A0A9W6BU88_9CHLO|nr:hypothetical protein PLESTM_000831300 [Pleodorina starrii]GLC57892.1 hypothetical protein PLESTB_001286100 [Pleodorina starrii]